MIPTGVGANVVVPVGDGEMGALVAVGVVGEAVPCIIAKVQHSARIKGLQWGHRLLLTCVYT